MENNQEKKVWSRLINNDGVILEEFKEGEGVKKTTKEQSIAIVKSYKSKEINEEVADWNKELGGFIFVLFKYCNNMLQQHPEITNDDITKLFYIATYVDYRGYLILDNNYISRSILRSLLKLHTNSFDTFFNKMKRLNIISQDENKYIKINKEYFSRGMVTKDLQKKYDYTRLYINAIRYLFDNVSPKKHRMLGNYFKMIPYIHRQINLLCWNPNSNKDKISLMTLRDVSKMWGYHRNTIKPFRNELFGVRLKNGESIIATVSTVADDWESSVLINPKIFYGGNFEEYKNKEHYDMVKLIEYSRSISDKQYNNLEIGGK